MSAFEDARLDFPSTERNREPIAQVLEAWWDPTRPRDVLELASGSGQHARFMALRFSRWTWQPSDREPDHLRSIEAYRQGAPENLRPAVRLDVSQPNWPVERYHGIVAINLLHISEPGCTDGLFRWGRDHLLPGGSVVVYGAFRRHGQHTAPSNEAFDADLRSRDPSWGVRCLEETSELAVSLGFRRPVVCPMPANNLCVRFDLRGDPEDNEEGLSR